MGVTLVFVHAVRVEGGVFFAIDFSSSRRMAVMRSAAISSRPN